MYIYPATGGTKYARTTSTHLEIHPSPTGTQSLFSRIHSKYEWILSFEADELHRLVDIMHQLRATQARLHVREEPPFFTGPRVELPTGWSGRRGGKL